MDHKQLARELLDEWYLCERAQVPKNVIDLQLAKDRCSSLAHVVDQEYAWGTSDDELRKACEKLAPALKKLKEQIVYEVLKDGTIQKRI
jgi:isochorismate hydrolase